MAQDREASFPDSVLTEFVLAGNFRAVVVVVLVLLLLLVLAVDAR